jgi:ABC-type phosphate transport system auxiliary subunit
MIVWGCAIVAIALVLAGAFVALREHRSLNGALEALKQHEARFDVGRLSAATERINADLAATQPLLERTSAALAQIRGACADLRLPQAVAAIRVAALAVKALRAAL